MSRTIAVKDSAGNDDYVVVEDSLTPQFYLSTGDALSLDSAGHFQDMATGFSYYVASDEDKEWLLGL
ncbi:hypothetical protein [Vreelandella populi]|uniref:Uncharacterized protein n=1 Tax=Vreelandella populi TaxID=2498858 RepID=A0A3S0WQA2_9GAMM|nr:hypothetical protein [Halomonas populi]RUR48779.1 hypothetical protein ELY37_02715 [Halomonas populi]